MKKARFFLLASCCFIANFIYSQTTATVTCGTTLAQNYCYGNSDVSTYLYTSSDGASPLVLNFLTGGIESCCDEIFIYDGVDATAPILTTITGVSDLTGISVTATGPNIFMALDSDSSVSCVSGSTCCGTAWDWTVDCLNCQFPEATAVVSQDCSQPNFTIDINITDLGDSASLDITDGVGTVLQGGIMATGIYAVGPFPNNIPVTIIVKHETNNICDRVFENLVNASGCVTCGTTLNQTYCYADDDVTTFSYVSSDGLSPLILNFTAGGIESCCDDIIIYDGVDATAPILTTITGVSDLTGITVSSTGTNLFIVVDSDGSISCDSGSGCCGTAWDWTVDCLNCMVPQATVVLIEDCATGFSLDVDITTLGDATSVNLLNGTTLLSSNLGTGMLTLGPFINGTSVNLILEHTSDPVCNNNLGNFVNAVVCPIIATIPCGEAPLNQTFCYDNNDATTWLYTASKPSATLTITFSQGYLESCCDDIIIYDGIDNTGTVLYDSNGAGTLAGVTVSSTGANIFMDINSDGSVSCSGGSGVSWDFDVECIGGCDFPTGTATYDCISNEITLEVTNAGLPVGAYTATIDGQGPSQTVNTTGTYPNFGPFTADQSYNVEFDDGLGCVSSIPYVFGGCELPRVPAADCVSLWSNSDFESGSTGWSEAAMDGNDINILSTSMFNTTLPLAGTNSAYFGGYGGSGISTGGPYTSTMSRVFFGQVGKEYSLAMWLVLDACDSPTDVFEIRIDETPIYSITGADVTCGDQKWRDINIDLPYADNMAHTIEFKLIENEANNSASRVFIDELLLEECTPLSCPPAYNGLVGVAPDLSDYETDGQILSIQTIAAGTTVDYDAGTEITLGIIGAGFEVQLGAVFCAFIDGCNGEGGAVNALSEEETSTILSQEKPDSKQTEKEEKQ